jgi:hypothetical protein
MSTKEFSDAQIETVVSQVLDRLDRAPSGDPEEQLLEVADRMVEEIGRAETVRALRELAADIRSEGD